MRFVLNYIYVYFKQSIAVFSHFHSGFIQLNVKISLLEITEVSFHSSHFHIEKMFSTKTLIDGDRYQDRFHKYKHAKDFQLSILLFQNSCFKSLVLFEFQRFVAVLVNCLFRMCLIDCIFSCLMDCLIFEAWRRGGRYTA